MVFMRGVTVLGEFDTLFAFPAAQMRGDGLGLEVARDLVVVGCDGDRFANEPRGHGIRIAITRVLPF
jgi:signal transduction histidine kinase